MKSDKHTVEQINAKLRHAKAQLAKGFTARELACKIGATAQTYYR